MAGRRNDRGNYIPDPKRREYRRSLRNIRAQVLQEYEQEYSQTGFLGRVFLRLKIEKEIRRRARSMDSRRNGGGSA